MRDYACCKKSLLLLLHVVLCPIVNAQFDFGGSGGGSSCDGSGTFSQQINQNAAVVVGDIPVGLQGLRISLTSSADVDIQMTSSSNTIDVINWETGIIDEADQVTRVWNGDSITYSGYNGVNDQPGNEFVQFSDETSNAYTMYAYAYEAGFASITYSWTGRAGCSSGGGSRPSASGSASFAQDVSQSESVTVGTLPAGLADVYVRLESDADIDMRLYDGSTALVMGGGLLSGGGFQKTTYAGVEIQYSGFRGEQRPDSYGQEYIFLKGILSRPLRLEVYGYATGNAAVIYSWGYYAGATSSNGNTLKSQLHDIIDGHDELSYRACWDALRRTDQDNSNPDSVIMFYSRRSEPKANQDTGCNCPDNWNREHVYAKSHGNFGTSQGAGTDIHALRAADKSVNSERSAKDFASGGSPLSSSEARADCTACRETNDTFEPPDGVKGDVARMLFYMAVRYNGDSNSNGLALEVVPGVGTSFGSSTSGNGELGDLTTLKSWHVSDPVSDEERHRNNVIYDIQGNRNPFIDRPELVEVVF